MGLWHEAQVPNLFMKRRMYRSQLKGTHGQNFEIYGHNPGRRRGDGCGTQSLPQLLADADISKVYGIDPIGGSYRAYNYYEGFAEFVPWYSRSFDRVVVATSFDHFIDPTVVMSQIHRVLKRGASKLGYFLWMTPQITIRIRSKRMDDFHVYHLNPNYWTKLVQPFFSEDHQSFNEGYKADTFFSYKKIELLASSVKKSNDN